jgi:hypothetical protein
VNAEWFRALKLPAGIHKGLKRAAVAFSREVEIGSRQNANLPM